MQTSHGTSGLADDADSTAGVYRHQFLDSFGASDSCRILVSGK